MNTAAAHIESLFEAKGWVAYTGHNGMVCATNGQNVATLAPVAYHGASRNGQVVRFAPTTTSEHAVARLTN